MKLTYSDKVYEPREDSYLLQAQVAKLCKGKKVIDMGCGTGIQAITAALNGASEVTAVDINPAAIKLTEKNAKLNNVNIKVIESNLFSNVPDNFDLIIFNSPYLPLTDFEKQAKELGIEHEALQWSGGKKVITEFLKQAKSHLNKDGTVLLVYSSITKLPGRNLKVLAETQVGFEKIFVAKAFLS